MARACSTQAAGSTRTVGRAAADTIRCLNHAMKGSLGIGLVTFVAPTPRPSVLHRLQPEEVPQNGFQVFLNLLPDQGAAGLLAIRHLYSTVGIFGVPLWDPLHRQWNDGKLGIQRAGLWGPAPSLHARDVCPRAAPCRGKPALLPPGRRGGKNHGHPQREPWAVARRGLPLPKKRGLGAVPRGASCLALSVGRQPVQTQMLL